MLDLTRILVPVDFSACSRAAVAHALRLASATGARLELLHVWDAPAYVTPEVETRTLGADEPRTIALLAREGALAELDDFIRTLELPKDRSVTSRVEFGRPPEVIARVGLEADLIVMGNHGRTGPKRWVLGSVAERVVATAPCPVLTVHADTPVRAFRRILVPIDHGEAGREALVHAASIAGKGASITLFSAFEIPAIVPGTSEGKVLAAEHRSAAHDAAVRRFERVLAEAGLGPEVAVEREVVEGPAVNAIIDAAAKADVVLIATHGRVGLGRLALGSVTARVVRESPSPVLSFRMSREAMLAERTKKREERRRTLSAYALFDDLDALGRAYDRLVRAGFAPEELSLVSDDLSFHERLKVRERTIVVEGAATGGLLGGALGSSIAVLATVGAGLAGGSALLVVGPALALAAAGGIIGTLTGLGIPRESADAAYRQIIDGKILLGVHTKSEERREAARILLFEEGGEAVDFET